MVVPRLVDSTPHRGVGMSCWVTADDRTVQISAKLPTGVSPAWSTAGVDIPDVLVGLDEHGHFHRVHADGTTTPVTDAHVAHLLGRPVNGLRFLLHVLNEEAPLHGHRL